MMHVLVFSLLIAQSLWLAIGWAVWTGDEVPPQWWERVLHTLIFLNLIFAILLAFGIIER